METKVEYLTTKTTQEFHDGETFVRGLMGPIGSGKSVACCWELFRLANAQEADSKGRRRTRFVIIRNTYRELVDTTMKTWFDWFPESIGNLHRANSTFNFSTSLPDGTTVECEILFRALDKPKDIKKLLSLELTSGWVNEAREVPKQIIDMLVGRLGRFPAVKDGGSTRHCLIMDTNPPDNDHWWYKEFEERMPEKWKLFRQPSALSDEAENLANLKPTYYEDLSSGKDPEWIKVYVHGDYGFVSDGRPVYPMYNDAIHYDENIVHNDRLDVHICVDFGLTPACAFIQKVTSGRYVIIDELVTTYADAFMFGDLLKERCVKDGYKVAGDSFGDPAGNQRAQTDSKTPFQIMETKGFDILPASTNDPDLRIGAVTSALATLGMDGVPRLTIGPKAKVIRKGFNGGYHYSRVQVSNTEVYKDTPAKDYYSHVHDAIQYGLIGLGQGDLLKYGKDELNNYKVVRGMNH